VLPTKKEWIFLQLLDGTSFRTQIPISLFSLYYFHRTARVTI